MAKLLLFLPLWPLFMNENGGYYFTATPCFVDVSLSLLPWFVYSNLLQSVSRSFINLVHFTSPGYFTRVVHADIRTSHTCESHLKFNVPRSGLSWGETVYKTSVLKTLSSTNQQIHGAEKD